MTELIRVIKEGNKQLVNARELHEFLENKRQFADWIKQRIEQYGFLENEDFEIKKLINGGRPRSEYIITLNMAICLCRSEKRIVNSGEMLEFLLSKQNKEIHYIQAKRFELSFFEQLDETLKPLGYEVEKQKSVFGGKYRIDGYIESLRLAIEYDEEQHKYQEEEDEQREIKIQNELECDFIRLDYNNTDAYNVGLVIKEIINRNY